MDIENKLIKVRVNNFNKEHFKNLGYFVEHNDYIIIKTNELPCGSGLKIDVVCKYCGKVFKKAYRRYLETKNDLSCKDCRKFKIMTTSMEKFGNICSLRNEIVLNKSKKTNLEKIGVEFPFQSKEILKKCIESLEKNGGREGFNVSRSQIYLYNLFGGKLNHIEFPYRLDIFFEKEKIYFEYDGSGHKLGIKFGCVTIKKFEEKQAERKLFLKNLKYKEFRIISDNDIFPEKEFLLKIKDRAFDFLLNRNYSAYFYDLNTKTESFEE